MRVTPRLLSLARDGRFTLAATVLSGIFTGLLVIGQAAALSQILDGVYLGGKSFSSVVGLLQLIILIVFLRALLAWGSEISASAIAVRIKNDLRHRLFDKILNLGPAYTHGERTGELVNTVMEGVESLDAYFSQYLPQLIIASFVPLSILVVVFPRDPLSGLVLILTAPLIPIFMYLIGKTAEKLTKRQWETLSLLSAHFLDSLQGLTTLKELGRSKEHAESIDNASGAFRDASLSVMRVTFLSALVLELVATVSTAVVAVEVGLRLLYGHLAFQQALFLLLLAPEFYLPLRMLGLRFHAGMSGTNAAKRIFEILDAPLSRNQGPAIQNQDFRQVALLPGSSIAFENISFVYPGETLPALQEITLEIHAGEHIALVGVSGAGKSTLAAMILRFIQPTTGQLTINQEPLSIVPLESWRSLVAWVPQNPYLFHDTIAANLLLARPEATDEQLNAATIAAHLDDFVQSLPHGYETVIGEEGASLSGGQAQRLALARAFLKDAPFLILDEPTSSLDPEQEMLVESAVGDLMYGRTVITIAHRLNTVFHADRIFVMDQGRLVESGTHSELISRGGIYAALVGIPTSVESPTSNVQTDLQPSTYDHRSSALPQPSISNRHSTVIRLLGFLRNSWGWLALSVLLGALTVSSNVGLMGTSAFLISAAALHPELGTLQIAIVGVRFFGIARGIFRYAERLTSHNVTFRLLAHLRGWFYRALEPLAPARLMEFRAGDLFARIVADVETLENFYVRVVAPPLVAMIVAGGMTIFFSRYDLPMSLVYLAFTIMLGIAIPLISWTLSRRAGIELVSRRAGLNARMVDGILGLADVLIFGRGADYSGSLISCGKAYGKSRLHLATITGFSGALTILLVNMGMLAVLGLAIPLVNVGKISGVMLAVLTLSALAGFEAVMPLPLAAQALSSSLHSARRLFEVVDATPAIREPLSVKGRSLPPRIKNFDLQISNLSFSYLGQSSPALQDVSFQLSPGKRIAIVGPSGAGKSTLASLLLRFWEPTQGWILLDGRNVQDYAQEDVRRQISFISQRTYFFNDTIRQNLLLARPTATELEMQNAAKKAQIHKFIIELPEGYETIIGERGFRLSAGERQRLAIGRALLKNAPIFLLDEPTANLDTLNERQILDTLITESGGKSLLLITHWLVELENMDEILVLDKGRIVERGVHATLLAAGGPYRRQWDVQNRILLDRIGA